MPVTLQPSSLKGDDQSLTIVWSDGTSHTIPWRILRKACPCATCRAEQLNPPPPATDDLLPVISKAEAGPMKVTGMRAVGNYAYAINFSDGHNTGIYSLDLLHELGDECARRL